jgi:GntR family transcriptional repressor for pyruvate dehydrogenase complex
MSESDFKTVLRDASLKERAEQQLRDLIVNQVLQSGERLPSQDKLGKRLGVSRTVIREAVCLLTAKGLLESRKGSGVYVRPLSSNLMREPFELMLQFGVISGDAVMEAREFLEVKLAGLAAARAKPENIKAMEQSIERMKRGPLTPAEFASTDVAFHSSLAAGAGNPLLLVMANSLNDIVINVRFVGVNLYGMERATELAIFHHSQILAAIKKGDPSGARQAMEEHLKLARTVLEELEARMNQSAVDAMQTPKAAATKPSTVSPPPRVRGKQ